ncbi:MAG: helix-turn-helix transcriptional regulator [Roseburia sp.]|nr:helix-turn-helix transcriptional regulator [Roseburia sp.]
MIDILDGKEIYKKVDALRLEKGWTIYGLAKQAGTSPTTLYNWRDRGSSPTLALLDAISSALEISVLSLLINEDDLAALTEEQKEVISLWNSLSKEQKQSIKSIMVTIKRNTY